MFKRLAISLAVFFAALAGFSPALAAEHIYNGDLSIPGSTDVLAGIDAKARPDGWFPAGFGDNSRTYIYGDWAQYDGPPVKNAKVKITRHVSGNASWISQDAPVTAGSSYLLTHSYRSDVPSKLGVRFKIGSAYSFVWLNDFGASDSWRQVPVSRTILVPAGATQLAVYHSISSVGFLEVGAFSLTDPVPYVPSGKQNLIPNPRFIHLDKDSLPVGWLHKGFGNSKRTYRAIACSFDKAFEPDLAKRDCPVERGRYASIDVKDAVGTGGEAEWYTEEIPFLPRTPGDPKDRSLHLYLKLRTSDLVYAGIWVKLPGQPSSFKCSGLAGGSAPGAVPVWQETFVGCAMPNNAESFSLHLTRWVKPATTYPSDFADIFVEQWH
jgi:hypothetical protein